MINITPSFVPDDAPNSEKKVFHHFKSDPGCSGWTVLHSLGLAQRGIKKPYGELDFVVIVPGEGIIGLEVKGGGVKCQNGTWSTTDRRGVTTVLKKSPFEQVRDGISAVVRAVHAQFGASSVIGKSFYTSAVVLTDVEALPKSIEYLPDEMIDINDLTKKISQVLVTKIRSQRERLKWANANISSQDDVKGLTKFLRPDFDLRETRSTRIRGDHQALIKLTAEQSRILDQYSENLRCLIKGAAGTGKTMLALEAYKRELANDKSVGLFCYNKVLGGWLRRETASYPKRSGLEAFCGSIYESFYSLIKYAGLESEFSSVCDKVPAQDSRVIYKQIMPEYALRAIIETGKELDSLILDEAQDLLSKEILDVFDGWLRGGLKNGKWSIFGDFHYQAIYAEGRKGEELERILEPYNHAKLKLSLNCRNTKNIAESTFLFSGFEAAPYEMNQIDGEAVNQTFWKSGRDLTEKLEKQIHRLLGDNIKPCDIAILSPRKYGDSAIAAVKSGIFKIKDITSRSDALPANDEITFSTIHSFKGMESPVIILTDIEGINTDRLRSLLYIGMSRASAYLAVLLHEGTKEDLGAIVAKKIKDKVR